MYCETYRAAAMPGKQRATSVWIASSVAVFLILTSFYIVLSLSSRPHKQNEEDGDGETAFSNGTIKVDRYGPKLAKNIAMLCTMSISILAMVVFIIKLGDATSADHEHPMTSRHILHRKISLFFLSIFFICGLIFHLNYVIVEFFCISRWTSCGVEVLFINIFDIIFHVGCMIFISCETVVCWVMKGVNFEPSLWIWLGLAVIQATNVCQWFDVLVKDIDRVENHTTLYEYFTFCNTTIADHQNRTEINQCSESSYTVQYFNCSLPFLFPVTIKLFLLVSENFLDRCIGRESHGLNQNDSEHNSSQEEEGNRHNHTVGAVVNERTPLLNENSTRQNLSCSPNLIRSKVFIMTACIISVIYFALSILEFKSRLLEENKSQTVADSVFTVYAIVFYLFLIVCSVVGIRICGALPCQHLRIRLHEYLLLFATGGVLLQSFKRVVVYAFDGHASGCVAELLSIIEATLQIVLYFKAKDVTPQSVSDNQHNVGSAVFNTIMIVMSIGNITNWIIDSYFLPYVDQKNDMFNDAVNPITIFFRFNSALLFWCIGVDRRLQDNQPAEPEDGLNSEDNQPRATRGWIWSVAGGLVSLLFTTVLEL